MRDATQTEELEDGSSNTVQLLIFGGVLLVAGLLFFGTVAIVMILKNGDDDKHDPNSSYIASNSQVIYPTIALAEKARFEDDMDLTLRDRDLTRDIDVVGIESLKRVESERIDLTIPESIKTPEVAIAGVDPQSVSGSGALAITSKPHRAIPGIDYEYQLTANQKSTFKLIKGPVGMTISDSGLVKWNVEPSYDGKKPIVVSVTSKSGANLLHTFFIDSVDR